MADPATEGNILLDPKGFHKLLEVAALRAIADDGKGAKSLRKRGAAARKARSQAFRGTKPPTKIRSSFAPGSGLRVSGKHNDSAMPGSGTKNTLSLIFRELGAYVWDEAAMIAVA